MIIVLSVIAGFFLLLIVLAAWLGPRVKDIAVQQINNYLTVPVKVDAIDFSFIRKFPYASVSFDGVSTPGAKVEGNHEPLLVARHIFLQFSWWDVFSDQLRLKKITIDDASCNLFVDRKWKENYDIFRKTDKKDGSFHLELEEIVLNKTTIRYHSLPGQRDYSVLASSVNCKGMFKEDVYDLSGGGDVFVERFKSGDVNYISNKETKLNVSIHMDTRRGLYEIHESTIRIADLELVADGIFRNEKEFTSINLKVQSKEAGLRELLSLFPGMYTDKLQAYDYDGSVYFNLLISGLISEKSHPLITVDFGTNNASLSPRGSGYTLSNIRFKGNYTNRVSATRPVERLQLNKLEALLEGQAVQLDLLVEDFSNPWINLTAKSNVKLEVLSKFYMPDTLSEMSGQLMVDAKIRGRTRESAGWISEGSVVARDVRFRLRESEVPYDDFNGTITLEGNRLTLSELSGKAAGSDFKINGAFTNVYAYLLSSDESLSGSATLYSRNLDLNELLEDKQQSTADTAYRLDFSDRVNVSLGIQIGILSFRKFQAWQVGGKLHLHDKILSGNDIVFKAFNGHLNLQGSIDASRSDSVLIACDADVKKLDVTELFTQMGNFGQDVIKDKNVKGKLTAKVQFASTWSKDLHCNFNKVYAKSKLIIENGELIDFEPMLALSRYLKSADLKQIKFETLQNEVEINGRTIFIPTMEIKSSIMDLTASGTHTFDNVVDYKLQLYLSQITGKKIRDRNTEFGTVEDDGLGRMRLFLTMKGPMSDPKITYDRKGIEQKITKDIKQEKQDLKKILNQEFGWFRKDSTVIKKADNQQKKQEELQLDTDPE